LKNVTSGDHIPATGPADAGAPTATLSHRLAVHREQTRVNRPEFAYAYDDLVSRLAALDRGDVGPKVGESMPPFQLPDDEGRLVSLASLLAHGPVVVSLNRGHWCPYCRYELRALAAIYDDIKRLGARAVSVMPDSAAYTAEYAQTNDLPFPVLSDIDLGYSLSLGLIFWVGAEVQRLYRDVGIDLERYHGNAGYFLPMAAKFVVDRDGIVRARQVNIEFRERMEPAAVLAALEQFDTARR